MLILLGWNLIFWLYTIIARHFIGKLYLDLIYLVDLGFTWSTPIHSEPLLILFQLPRLALLLIKSNQESVSWLWSNFEYSGRLRLCFDLIKIYFSGYYLILNTQINSGLSLRSCLWIVIQFWMLRLTLILLWSMSKLIAWSQLMYKYSD